MSRMVNAVLTWAFQLAALGVLIPTTYYLFDYFSGDVFHPEILCHDEPEGRPRCLDRDDTSFAWKLLPLLSLLVWHLSPVVNKREKLFKALDIESLHSPASLVISCCIVCFAVLRNNHFPGLNLWVVGPESEALHLVLLCLHGFVWIWIISSALGFSLLGRISKNGFTSTKISSNLSIYFLLLILFWSAPCMSYDRFFDATIFTAFTLFFKP